MNMLHAEEVYAVPYDVPIVGDISLQIREYVTFVVVLEAKVNNIPQIKILGDEYRKSVRDICQNFIPR